MAGRRLIAFLGQEGGGKTYNANKLVEECGFTKLSFADALREMAFKIIGMDFDEGMKQYAQLKQTELFNGLNFRNILENLGSAVREHTEDFWVDVVIDKISKTDNNICIDDMRYVNEYVKVYNFCVKNNIEFKAYFCNYNSEFHRTDNPHESAKLANHLYNLNYKDLQEIDINDILLLKKQEEGKSIKKQLSKALKGLRHAKNI